MNTKDKNYGENIEKIKDNEGNASIIQYRFSAYLKAAVKNRRKKFTKEERQRGFEESVENFENILTEGFPDKYFFEEKNGSYEKFLEFATKYLSKTEADVVFLHICENYSLKETAMILNLNYSYIRNILSKSMKKIKDNLEGQYE